jgi:CheY-like chemotaxis protein
MEMAMNSLSGRSIMIVEDGYYLAMDAKGALEAVGARVLGPYSDAEAALECLEREQPDCAVLDLNLGDGPTFQLAEAMRAREVPFVFFTGYDESAIPAEFADVARLEKPVRASQLLQAVDRQLGGD